jgi:hypothetical protein
VPKTRILVFRENVSPFLEHPTLVPFFKLGGDVIVKMNAE